MIDSNISHDEFVSVNNVLIEHDDMKEKIKSSNNKQINMSDVIKEILISIKSFLKLIMKD